MSDPPRLRDLGGPENDFARSLLRDAAPTKPLTAAHAAHLEVAVSKAATVASTGGFFATAVVPKALAAIAVVALGSGAVVAARHRGATHAAQASAHVPARAPMTAGRVAPVRAQESVSEENPAANVAPVAQPAETVAPSARAHATVTRARVAAAEPTVAVEAPPAQRAPTLGEELHVVDSSRASLASNPARALSMLSEADRNFTGGQLVDEREALRIEALARLDRWSDARDRAAVLTARSPHSPQAARVRALLEAHQTP